MNRVKAWLPPTSLVTIPQILLFDAKNNVIIMEDCGSDSVPLREFLRSGKASQPGMAEKIGTSLGEFIASMHEWSRGNPDDILHAFNACTHSKESAVTWNCRAVLDTLKQNGENIPPVLLDPPLEMDTADLQTISKMVKELQNEIMAARDVVSHSP
jgi:hypothetical protein